MKFLLCIGMLITVSLSPGLSMAQPPQKMGKLIVFNYYIGIVRNDSVIFYEPHLDDNSYKTDSLKGPWKPAVEKYSDDDGKEVVHSPNIKIPAGTRQIITNERLWATVSDSAVTFQNHIVGKDTGLVFSIPKGRQFYFLTGLASTEADLLAVCNLQLVYTNWDGGPWKQFRVFDSLFRLPPSYENVFMYGMGALLVQTHNKLQMYSEVTDMLTSEMWYKYHPEFDFDIPAGTDEVIIYNTKFIGLRTARTVTFYALNRAAKTWEYKKGLNFDMPF